MIVVHHLFHSEVLFQSFYHPTISYQMHYTETSTSDTEKQNDKEEYYLCLMFASQKENILKRFLTMSHIPMGQT